jgi:predicted AAA+ superfamily ATPase
MISRSLLPLIKGRLHQGKVVVLLGARQVGKTTLEQQAVRLLYVAIGATVVIVTMRLFHREVNGSRLA